MGELNEYTPITLILLVLYVMVKEVVAPLVKKRTENGNGKAEKKSTPEFVDIVKLEQNVASLHKMHDQRDAEGRLIWWTPTGFRSALEANTKANLELVAELKLLNRHHRNGGK